MHPWLTNVIRKMRPWVVGSRIRRRCGQNLVQSIIETWFCPDRDTLGVCRLELPKLMEEDLLPDVEALPAGQAVYPVRHILTWEADFGLRLDDETDENDDTPTFDGAYRQLFSRADLDSPLNLSMFPLIEDVTFAFERLHPSLFVPGSGLQAPAGGDCELACRIDTDGAVMGVWFRRTSRDRFRDVHRALMEPDGRSVRVPSDMIARLTILRTDQELQDTLTVRPDLCEWVRLTGSYRGEDLKEEGRRMSLMRVTWHRLREGINEARIKPIAQLKVDYFTFLYDSSRNTGPAKEDGLWASERLIRPSLGVRGRVATGYIC